MMLDYYVVREPESATPAGLVVEEFVLGADHAAVRLDSAAWSAVERRWVGSPELSRALRADAGARARVTGVDRRTAEMVFGRLDGGDLPVEATLRTYLGAGEPMAAPLRLGPRPASSGFHESRVYRILLAGEPGDEGLTSLRSRWGMTSDDADPRIAGTARRDVDGDRYVWQLRQIGPGTAWGVDLTVDLAGARADGIAVLVREVMTATRDHGLIPVTVDRFG